ncbi:MAG: efflux RND transporter periplasmic adaptor subunit [Bacteroidota bacterium]|nr:efflux RND transporter periplasmic adaptor subunit [Flavisolibacter sp.]MDQ3846873.1 efflux RND transporter periplasmic adaptor subunit [Bacteroidota bacterium]
MKLIYFLFILLLSYALASCGASASIDDQPPFSLTDTMLKQTEFTKADVQQVANEMKLFGKVTASNNKQAQVFPLVGGTVTKVNVELGDYVKQGQVLAVIRSGEVAGFDRERMDALSDVALAEKNLRVAKDLYEGKLTTEKDVVAAEKELQKARAELNRVREVFNVYRIQPGSYYNVTAPISGFIIDKDVNQNMQLRSDKSDQLFSIAQIDEVWVLANVNESDIGKIATGMEAEIYTISYPDHKFVGKVDKIFNVLDPDTKALKVRIRIPNTNLLLKPEMNATVRIKYKENRQLVAVPSSAVIFDKSKNWVMVYKGRNDIETRMVEVYRQAGGVTYLLAGLQPGETVISKNGLLVYDALND